MELSLELEKRRVEELLDLRYPLAVAPLTSTESKPSRSSQAEVILLELLVEEEARRSFPLDWAVLGVMEVSIVSSPVSGSMVRVFLVTE